MSRLKREEKRESRLPKKRDTPLKTTLRRRSRGQRFVAVRHFEELPELTELAEFVKPLNPIKSNLNPGPYKAPGLHGCSSALIGDPEENAALPGAIVSLESDTTSSDDDEDGDTCSSASSSSLPSPEVFRKETSNVAPIFSFKEGIPAVHHNKNSTLLDASHAVSIHMHPAPNLSTISDNSDFWPGHNFEIKYNKENEPEVRMGSSTSSANKVVESKTELKLIKKTPILFKKKVWFKNPLTESKQTPASKLPLHCDSEPFQTFSSVKNVKAEDDRRKESQMDSGEVFQVKAKPERSTIMTPERVRLFNFSSDSDREVFFQRMRERCDKLWNYPLFPLAAGNT